MRIPEAKTRAGLWLLAVIGLAVLFGVQLWRGVGLQTNILDLLPATERDPVVATATRQFSDQLGRRMLFLVGDKDPAIARAAAGELADALTASPLYEQVTCRIDASQQRAWFDLYLPHRLALLTPTLQRRLSGLRPPSPPPPPVTITGNTFVAMAVAVPGSNADGSTNHEMRVFVGDGKSPGIEVTDGKEPAPATAAPQDPTAASHEAGARFLHDRMALIYSPMGAVQTQLLDRDPLLLLPDYLARLGAISSPGKAHTQDGMLMVDDGDMHYVLVAAVSRGNPFTRSAQLALVAHLDPLLAQLRHDHPSINLLEAGVLRFAAHAGKTAQWEASTIGLGSIIGILLLLLVTFRSPRYLVLSLVPIGVGVLAAFSLSYAIFGGLHVITLAFGASMIGVCIDYTLHYFSEELLGDEGWTGRLGLAHILPGITLGAVTSIAAYLALLIAPFPGLRQMAVFSAIGLTAAYLTVVCWLPLLLARRRGGTAHRPATLLRLVHWLLATGDRWGRTKRAKWALLVVLIGCAFGIQRLTVDDDVRRLQNAPEQLKRDQATVARLFGMSDGNRYFVVEGRDEAELLRRDETLQAHLENERQFLNLEGFRGVSTYVPSPIRQAFNTTLLRKALLTPGNQAAQPATAQEITPPTSRVPITPPGVATAALTEYVDTLGIAPADAQALIDQLNTPVPPLTVQEWLDSPASAPLRQLWLGPTGRGVAAIVMLDSVHDDRAMAELESAVEGVTYVNQVEDINDLLGRYREITLLLLGVAYLLILVLVIWRYGVWRGCRVLGAPALAAACTLAFFGAVSVPLNLFSLLALLLVLGIGIDYTIFLAEGGERRDATMLAILLSAITTLLSFGLLALSSTPILRDFGSTILIGIVLSLFLAPLFVNGDNAKATAPPPPPPGRDPNSAAPNSTSPHLAPPAESAP